MCKILNSEQGLLARHYQYRLESFFKEVFIDAIDPINNIKYYSIRNKFQQRESPCGYCLIWTENATQLSEWRFQRYCEFLDNNIKTFIPSPESNSTLYNLVKFHQIHWDSKAIRIFKKSKC